MLGLFRRDLLYIITYFACIIKSIICGVEWCLMLLLHDVWRSILQCTYRRAFASIESHWKSDTPVKSLVSRNVRFQQNVFALIFTCLREQASCCFDQIPKRSRGTLEGEKNCHVKYIRYLMLMLVRLVAATSKVSTESPRVYVYFALYLPVALPRCHSSVTLDDRSDSLLTRSWASLPTVHPYLESPTRRFKMTFKLS